MGQGRRGAARYRPAARAAVPAAADTALAARSRPGPRTGGARGATRGAGAVVAVAARAATRPARAAASSPSRSRASWRSRSARWRDRSRRSARRRCCRRAPPSTPISRCCAAPTCWCCSSRPTARSRWTPRTLPAPSSRPARHSPGRSPGAVAKSSRRAWSRRPSAAPRGWPMPRCSPASTPGNPTPTRPCSAAAGPRSSLTSPPTAIAPSPGCRASSDRGRKVASGVSIATGNWTRSATGARPFGYWQVPDQAAMALLEREELSAAGRLANPGPRFVVFPTVSTHAPFVPIAPFRSDWTALARTRGLFGGGTGRGARRARGLDSPHAALHRCLSLHLRVAVVVPGRTRRSGTGPDRDRGSPADRCGHRPRRALGRTGARDRPQHGVPRAAARGGIRRRIAAARAAARPDARTHAPAAARFRRAVEPRPGATMNNARVAPADACRITIERDGRAWER